MPSTPKIVTRSETTSSNSTENLNKGSKLTFAEMDSNFIELRNGTIGIVGDDSTGIDIAQGSTLKVAGTGGISTSVSGDTLTVDASSIVTTSLGDLTAIGSTLISPSNADITLDPSGTGNVVANADLVTPAITIHDNTISTNRSNDDLELEANGTGDVILNPTASSYQQVVIKGGGDDGGTIHPQLKIVDEEGTELLFGNSWSHASRGSTLASGSGDPLHIQGGNGTESINLYASGVQVNSDLTTTGGLNTDGIEIKDNNIKATRTNDDLILQTNNTGEILLEANIKAGVDAASGLNHTNMEAGNNTSLTLKGGSTGGQVRIQPGPGNGTGEVGDIELTPGSSGAVDITQGDLKIGTATISNNSITLDQLAWSGNSLTTTQTNADLELNTSGTGKIKLGDVTVDPINTGKTGYEALNIPFSADGSTSQDFIIQFRDDAPEIYFNNAGQGGSNQAARIRVGTGDLTLQTDASNSSTGNIRVQSGGDITLDAAGNINLGGDTIVVSGNRMFTDDSNEDFELEANGTGNISMLSPANMNSNRIVNVTDPTANQDAATKAYVDANVSDVTASSTTTFTNKTFDANGTGNSITNLEVADLATGVLDTDISTVSGSDDTIASAKAIKTYVDAQVLASGDTGDLTINGSTITAPSNADLTLAVAGTGVIEVDGTLTATEVISDLTGTIEFDAKATEAITKGEAVYIAGIDGNTPTVALARANAAGTMPGFGIAATDIALNATGKITTFGSLTGLDAADFGETAITFALGDTVYISSAEAGKLTNVAPTGESNFIQNIGKIERASPTTNITIKVGGAGRTNATPALDDGNIFIGNSSNASGTVALAEQIKNYKAVTVVGDDSTGTDVNIGETFKVAGTQNVSTAVSGDTLTVTGPDLTPYATTTYVNAQDANIASDTLTFTNKTFDVEGTGNSISNIDVADLKSGVLDTDLSSVSGSDDTLASAKAIKAYVDSQGGAANTGDITFNGSTIISPSNADITLNPAGTGRVNINAVYTLPNADGTADQILGTNGSGVLSFRDPTAINIDGGVADSVYTSTPTIDGGQA